MTKKEIKELDNLWAKMVKNDAGLKCELSGECNCQLHPHHYIGRRNRATRWYLPNGVCLSASRHTMSIWSAHQNPEWFRQEMLQIRGDKWLEDIIKQSSKVCKTDFDTVKAYLGGELDNYC